MLFCDNVFDVDHLRGYLRKAIKISWPITIFVIQILYLIHLNCRHYFSKLFGYVSSLKSAPRVSLNDNHSRCNIKLAAEHRKFFSRKLNKICNRFHLRLFPQLRKIYDTKIQLDCMSFKGIDYVCGFKKVLQHHCIMLVCYSNLVKVAIPKDWHSWLSNWFGWLVG